MAAKRAVIYCRTSSDDTKRDSLSSQAEDCKRYCDTRGYRIVDELREDVRGVSGADMFAPALREAIKLAEQGRYDILIVRDITRFSRDEIKAVVCEYELNQNNVKIEYVWNQFPDNDDATPFKFFYNWSSRKEKENIVKRMKRGREKRMDSGIPVFHQGPPFGYYAQREGELRVTRAYIEPDEAEIVKLIYELYVHQSLSIRGTSRELNDRHFTTRLGKKWDASAVRRILIDTSYIGDYIYGRKHSESEQKTISIPAIISQELFNQAKAKLAENANKRGRKPKYDYLVGRRIKCACGSPMHGKGRVKHNLFYYSCSAYQAGKTTDECVKYARVDKVDRAVWTWLESILRDKNLLREKIESVFERYEAQAEPLRVTLRNIEKLIEARQRQIQRLTDIIANTEDAPDSIVDSIRLRESEIAGLEAELENVKHELLNVDVQYEMRELYQGNPEIWPDMWTVIGEDLEGELDFEKRRQYIERFDVNVTVTKDNSGTWLHIESDLGEVFTQIDAQSRHVAPKRYTLIITDILQLA